MLTGFIEGVRTFLDEFDFIVKIFSNIAVVVSAVLLVKYLGYRHKRPILRIFKKPFFFGFFFFIQMAFVFRQNRNVYLRQFTEYLIFKYPNEKVTYKKIKRAFNEFRDLYIKKNRTDYSVKSIFQLEDILESAYLTKYFAFFTLDKNKKRYDVDEKQPVAMLIDVTVENGYLAPITSFPGLQDHYNDDWSSILNNYINSFTANDKINESELFSFYMWLMWGPSCALNFRRRDYKLIQYGIGDESKSYTVVLNGGEKQINLWDLISSGVKENQQGIFCSLTLRLNEKNSYIDANDNMFGNSTYPFLKRYQDSYHDYILEVVDYRLPIARNDGQYFFAAYIWALFVRKKSIEDATLDITDCVSFFEHANLSDTNNYKHLVDSLINKIVTHFERNYKNNEHYYYLNSTFNDHIYEKLSQRFLEISKDNTPFAKWVSKYIILDTAYSFDVLLEKFDEKFSTTEYQVKIREVKLNDKESLEMLGRFYVSIYLENFPDENERETLDNFLQYLRNEEQLLNGENHYHILLATIDNQIVGGIIGDYFSAINSGVFEFLVVDQKYRRHRIGARLIEAMTNTFNVDSKRYKKGGVNYIFIESEHPNLVTPDMSDTAKSRIEFWRKQRFFALDFTYIQPSIDTNKDNVLHLLLGVKLCKPNLSEQHIDGDILKQFIIDYAKYAMSIDKPHDDLAVQKNIENINENQIKLCYLDEYTK